MRGVVASAPVFVVSVLVLAVACTSRSASTREATSASQPAVSERAASLPAATRPAPGIVWEPTHGPYGGTILSMHAAPDGTLYTGTSGGGVFRWAYGAQTADRALASAKAKEPTAKQPFGYILRK